MVTRRFFTVRGRLLLAVILFSILALAAATGGLYVSSGYHLNAARDARRNDSYAEAERRLGLSWRFPGLEHSIELERELLGVQQGDLSTEAALQARTQRPSADAVLILEALAKGKLATFDWNGARTYAEAILERQSDNPQALWVRGRSWVRLQQEPKAQGDFAQALESEPAAFEIRLSQADLRHKLGHVREADALYLSLWQQRPADARVVIALAHCRQEEGLLEDARKLVDDLLEWNPNLFEALLERGRIALRLGRHEEGERWLRKALAQRPDHTDAGFVLQLCLDAQKKDDESLSERFRANEPLQVALRLKIQDTPRDPALLTEQGRWLMRAGDWQEAVGWFYLALAADVTYAPAHAGLADYFALAEQPRRSLDHARLSGAAIREPPPSLAPRTSPLPISLSPLPPLTAASEAEVHRICAACHAYPPPASFPRAAWRKEVKQGYDLLRDSPLGGAFPPLESVVQYYEQRAAEQLPLVDQPKSAPAAHFRFEPLRTGWMANVPPYPGIANLHLAGLFGGDKLELLACDTRLNRVLMLRPYGASAGAEILPQILAPCHTAVVDLDRDGQQDILVAGLGQFYPTDAKVGSVAWLRQSPAGKFEQPRTLLENVGRVSDVQAADFNGDGKLDLVVAAFGWRRTGEILYLENCTSAGSNSNFVCHEVDPRHGAIHVSVVDFNRDGRPDFVALLSQEHEAVVAYLNEGGTFRQETIYRAPHPAYGSSGIEVVDLDGDGDFDVLLTNGDVLDRPYLLKPYHGIQWLENEGKYPFTHHPLAPMYGASRAVAADFDGDQDLDIAAVSFLPRLEFPEREELRLPSLMLLEQTSRGQFATHVLETGACDHFTCAAGDWDGDGDADLAVGNFSWKRSQAIGDAAVLWKNVLQQR